MHETNIESEKDQYLLGKRFINLMKTVLLLGVDRLCRDTEFMLGRNPGLYWRICWGIVTPFLMIAILFYTFVTYKPLTYRNYVYPSTAYGG